MMATISAPATMGPNDNPLIQIALARARSFMGNQFATKELATGQRIASPTPRMTLAVIIAVTLSAMPLRIIVPAQMIMPAMAQIRAPSLFTAQAQKYWKCRKRAGSPT